MAKDWALHRCPREESDYDGNAYVEEAIYGASEQDAFAAALRLTQSVCESSVQFVRISSGVMTLGDIVEYEKNCGITSSNHCFAYGAYTYI